MVMDGSVQPHYKHAVHKETDREATPRFNLAFRWVTSHGKCCPQHPSHNTREECTNTGDQQS